MPVEIQSTIVTPGKDGNAVTLHISDGPPGDESAPFVLEMTIAIGAHANPTLAEIQRDAIKAAQDRLSQLLPELAKKVQSRAEMT